MTPVRVFWGTLFVAFGTFFLFSRFVEIPVGWDFVWKFWPLIFVVIGLAVMFRDARVKLALASVGAIGLGFFLYGIFSFSWIDSMHGEEWDLADGEVQVQEFSEPLSEEITKATLVVDAAAGSYRLEESTDQLFAATVRTSIGRYLLDRDPGEGSVHLRFKPEGHVRIRAWKPGRAVNEAEIRLSTRPVWDMEINAGAAKVDFDLSPFKVANVTLEAGATSVRLRLGVPVTETHCRVETGASSIKIEVPEETGCEISYDGGLSSTHFKGFDRTSERVFQTNGFDDAPKKIFIKADAGVSSISVVRY